MKRIKQIIFALSIALLSGSCSIIGDIDNIHQEGVIEEDQFINTGKDAANAVRGIYSLYRETDIAAFTGQLEVRAGLLSSWYYKETTGFATNTVPSTLVILNDYYIGNYLVINQCNTIIKHIETDAKPLPGLSAEVRGHFVGVAYFFRALCHLNLLQTFGQFYHPTSAYGIAYVTLPSRDNSNKPARATVQESFKQIMADLDHAEKRMIAISKLPADCQFRGSVSLATVKALKARVLLSEAKYPEAEKMAKEAITTAKAQGVTFAPDYASNFSMLSNNPAILLSINAIYPERPMMYDGQYPISESAINLANGLISDPSFVASNGNDQPNDDEGNPSGENGDDGDNGDGDDNPDEPAVACNEPILKTILNTTNVSGIIKKANPGRTNGQEEQPSITIRLSEPYYIMAESQAQQGKFNDAIASLKEVLAPVGYTEAYFTYLKAHHPEVLQRIILHKHIDFICENAQPYYDDMRLAFTKKLDIVGLQLLPNMNHLAMPIPISALGGNNKIKQNPDYEGQ